MTEAGGEGEAKTGDESRREFLRIAATISAGLAVLGIASVMKAVVIPAVPSGTTTTSALSFPRVKVSSLSEVSSGTAVIFNYPLDNEPNVIVKLGQQAAGGIGPDKDIIAFSQVCQHLGCIWGYVPTGGSPAVNKSYVAPSPVAYCPCHGSIFDLKDGAKVIGGPAPRPQPQVTLELDGSGDIYAVGMSPPSVFGHNTGSSDPTDDLKGGNLVTRVTTQ